MQWWEEFYGNLCFTTECHIQLGRTIDRIVNDWNRNSSKYTGPCLDSCCHFEEPQWSSLAFFPFLSGKFFCSQFWEFALPLRWHLSACGDFVV